MISIRCARPHRLWEPMVKDLAAAYRAGSRVVLLVPEQYTLQAERDLLRDLSLPGFFRIDILSPSRLEYRVFNAFGSDGRARIDERGKAVALTRALQREKDRLQFYAGAQERPGFIKRMGQLLSTLKLLQIQPQDLLRAAGEAETAGENKPLWHKLRDTAMILEGYEELLAGRFADREDIALDMRARLAHGRMFEGTEVFVYGFDLLTEAFSQVLYIIAAQAKSLHISMVSDKAQAEDGDAFSGARQSVFHLMEGLKERHLEYQFQWYEAPHPRLPDDLAHLEKNLLSLNEMPYRDTPAHIRLYAGPTPYREVQRVAQLIMQEARRGVALDDMMLLCGSLPVYRGLIESTCQSYGIPCYVADKLTLSAHRVPRYLLAALRCAADGYRQEDVTEMIKSGLSPLTREEGWGIENYALRYGIRQRKWLVSFTRGQEEEKNYAEALRLKLIEPVESLHRALARSVSAAESLAAVRAFLEESGVPRRAEALEKELDRAGLQKELIQLRQVFDQLDEMFEQMAALMGDERIPLKHFPLWLENGLSERELSALPPSGGHIQAGQLGNLLPHRPRVVFALGLNDGILAAPEDGLLTQEETKEAEAVFRGDFGLDTPGHEQMKALDLLKALSAPSERLYLSYALAGEEGAALHPLTQLKAIGRLFPQLVEEGGAMAGRANDAQELPLAPMPALETLALKLQAGETDERWRGAWAWMGQDHMYRARAASLIEAMGGKPPMKSIGRAAAGKLFDTKSASVSRLEKFASCPFRHFVEHGLRPQRRLEWTVEPVDTGNFYHKAMDGFTRLAVRDGAWPKVDQRRAEQLMDEAMAPLVAGWKDEPFYDTARLRKMSESYRRVARRMAWMVTRGAMQSRLSPAHSELHFGDGTTGSLPAILLELSDGSMVELHGVIDRLDKLKEDGEEYLRVIDYKSGNMRLIPEELYEGAQLQLMIYLQAALNSYPGAIPAGAFYQRLADPLIDTEDADAARAEGEKKLRLSGIILKDLRVARLMDEQELTLGRLFNKDESPSKTRKDLLEEGEIRQLGLHAVGKARELAERISSGEIERLPMITGKRRACEYCPYQGICRIDWQAGDKGRTVPGMTLEQVLEEIRDQR